MQFVHRSMFSVAKPRRSLAHNNHIECNENKHMHMQMQCKHETVAYLRSRKEGGRGGEA